MVQGLVVAYKDKEVAKARGAAYYAANKAKHNATMASWYLNNKEKLAAPRAAYRAANREKLRVYAAEHYRNNKTTYTAKVAKRRAAKMKRTPVWAETRQIEALYACAARLSSCLQMPFDVDNVYPLQGQLVSGLHVLGNLQILSASANRRKSNSWKPEHGA